jgi:hypothetical protein
LTQFKKTDQKEVFFIVKKWEKLWYLVYNLFDCGLGLGLKLCLMPPKYPEKTTDMPQVTESLSPPVSYTNKTDCHDITEILLRVALSIITLTPNPA